MRRGLWEAVFPSAATRRRPESSPYAQNRYRRPCDRRQRREALGARFPIASCMQLVSVSGNPAMARPILLASPAFSPSVSASSSIAIDRYPADLPLHPGRVYRIHTAETADVTNDFTARRELVRHALAHRWQNPPLRLRSDAQVSLSTDTVVLP